MNKPSQNLFTKKQLMAIVEALPTGGILIHSQGILFNKEIIKLNPEIENIGELRDLFHFLFRNKADLLFEEYRDNNTTHSNNEYIQHINIKGEIRHLKISISRSEYFDIWTIEDITEKIASENKFKIIFEGSSNPHLILIDNQIIDCNQATLKLLNYSNKSFLLNKSHLEFSQKIQNDGRGSLEKYAEMDFLAQENGEHSYEWSYRDSEQNEIPVQVNLIPTVINNQSALLSIWNDLREIKRNEKDLNRERENALVAAKTKSRFLATMSHEIRTPLNGIIGMANLLLDEKMSLEQRKKLEIICRSGDSLLTIINDILDFSKLESEKVQIENVSFNIKHSLEDIVELLKYQTQIQNNNIIITIQEGCPKTILGDESKLHQVLLNLLSNAIKFTQAGQIELKLNFTRKDENNYIFHFQIIDTGIGISPQNLKMLFKSFSQVDASISREYGGTGLGLAISKGLIELMGGKIWVESEEGKGSNFQFELQLSRGKEIKKHLKISHDNSQIIRSLESISTLVVEDNRTNQLLLKQYFEKLNHFPDFSANGAEALIAVKSKSYDLILMDCLMPLMNGLEATQAIREMNELENQPYIVAVSANIFPETIEEFKKVGTNEYLEKPLRFPTLCNFLMKFFSERVKLINDNNNKKERHFFDAKELSIAFSGDFDILQSLLTKLEERMPRDLSNAKIYLERKQYGELANWCHTLRGSLSIFAAFELVEILEKMEKNIINKENLNELEYDYENFENKISLLPQQLNAFIQNNQ